MSSITMGLYCKTIMKLKKNKLSVSKQNAQEAYDICCRHIKWFVNV